MMENTLDLILSKVFAETKRDFRHESQMNLQARVLDLLNHDCKLPSIQENFIK